MDNKDGNDRLEALDGTVQSLLSEPTDKIFTEYLRDLQKRIQSQKLQVDLLQEELQRNQAMYETRKRSQAAQPVAQEPPGIQEIPKVAQPPAGTPGSRGRRSAEFTVGAAVLSIVGGGFILAALVMLGMNFMTGFVRGMLLYAAFGGLLLVSELVVYPRWERLGFALSAIAIGGLYLSTVVNTLALHNLGVWAALGITLVVTLLVIGLSRKRASVTYRAMCMIACYLCMLMPGREWEDTSFLILTGILLLMNIACVAVSVRKHRIGMSIFHLLADTVFVQVLLVRTGGIISQVPKLVLVLSSFALVHLLLIACVREKGRLTGKNGAAGSYQVLEVSSAGMLTAYGIGGFFHIGMLLQVLRGYGSFDPWLWHGSAAAAGIIGLLAFAVLYKYREKWSIYYLCNVLALWLYGATDQEYDFIICLIAVFVVSKLLSLLKKPELKAGEAVITALACLVCLFYYDDLYGVILLAVILASILFLRYWRAYYELLITYTVVFFAALSFPPVLVHPVCVGILFAGLLLFNHVKTFQGKGIAVYNALALTGQVCLLLLFGSPVYAGMPLSYFCMLVFGVATIVLTFQPKYSMDFKGKYLVLAIFLTYMALIARFGSTPLFKSMLLMLVAFLCVGLGFLKSQKPVRIYGLALSLAVCGKMVLYDFLGVPTLQKTFLFFAVGVTALAISAIYIVLDKKM